MTRLAVVSAMHQELSAVLETVDAGWRPVERAGRTFWLGLYQGHEVVAVLSRIGKVAAAATAVTLIEHFQAGRIVFTGVAGGLGDGVQVGDMVVADAFVQHDMDASPLFPRHEVPLYGRSRFETDEALRAEVLAAAVAIADRPQAAIDVGALSALGVHAPRVHSGLVASGDRFVSTAAESGLLRQTLPAALAVEMEGAAFAQVCSDYGVPFAAMRTISDRADDSAHVDFMRFIESVASHYSAAVSYTHLRAHET